MFLKELNWDERGQVLEDWEQRTRIYMQTNNTMLAEKHNSALETLEALRTFIASENTTDTKRAIMGLCNNKKNILALVSLEQDEEAVTVSHFMMLPRQLNDEEDSCAVVCMLTIQLQNYATAKASLPLRIEHDNIKNIFGAEAAADSHNMADDDYDNFDDDDDLVELRIDPLDGGAYAEEEFREYYGDEWQEHWDSAKPVDVRWYLQNEKRVEPQSGEACTEQMFKDTYGVDWQAYWNASELVEQRIDPIDGGAFTEEEFKDYYGDDWQQRWDSAKPLELEESEEAEESEESEESEELE